jgi:hypothetical protein
MRKRQFLDFTLLFAATGFAGLLQWLQTIAAMSGRWRVLVFPPLGPFRHVGYFFLNFILPGIPFLFVSVIVVRRAKSSSTVYRTILIVSVIALAIFSFWNISWLVWFIITVIPQGGKF